jgi:hypothetical protein
MGMTMSKPTKHEVVTALEILIKWAIGSDRNGNPYQKPAVKHALRILAREKGIGAAFPFEVEVRNLAIPVSKWDH